MKKCVVLLVLMFVFVGGCEESLTPQQAQELAAQTQVLTDKVDGYQEAVETIADTLEGVGVVDPNLTAKLDKINREVDRLQPQVNAIAVAVEGATLSGDDLQDWITLLQKANVASAPFNPYALPVGGALTLISVILGIFAAKKKKEADENAAAAIFSDAKYQAHKRAVELFSLEQPKEAANLYTKVGDARADLNV